MNQRIFIGTSGWSYDHWQGPFYPDALTKRGWLAYCTKRFRSLEINSSFYRLPHQTTLRRWRDTAPAGFPFSVKASRYITHMKKLKDPQDGVTAFLRRIGILDDRLGPILFQLPPRWRFNAQRLAGFLDTLSDEFRYAFEFRDRSWLCEQTYALLAEHNAAFCIYELDGFLSPKEITTDFIYVRLHGPEGPYEGNYDDATLSGWANTFSSWLKQNRSVYCYFDNDEAGYAARNVLTLQSILQKKNVAETATPRGEKK